MLSLTTSSLSYAGNMALAGTRAAPITMGGRWTEFQDEQVDVSSEAVAERMAENLKGVNSQQMGLGKFNNYWMEGTPYSLRTRTTRRAHALTSRAHAFSPFSRTQNPLALF